MYKIILTISLMIFFKAGFSQSDNYKQMRLFNKLWGKINNHYASFEIKGVDWQESYDWIKPKISKDLTQEQLMDTISIMLDPLNDGHLGVLKFKFFPLREIKGFSAERESQFHTEFPTDSLQNELFNATSNTLQKYGFQKLESGYQNDNSIIDFVKSENIGYIHISNMEGIKKRKVKNTMKAIVHELSDSDGLIIDVRANNGGFDNICDMITSFFIDSVTVARYEQTRKKKSYNSFTKAKKITIKPQEITFTKNIIILTNDRTRSAGEFLVLALKDLHYVTIVGDRTEGILGGTKIGLLPYGWIYALNKWKNTSRNHIWYEDIGIPPDFLILNKAENIENNSDPLIEKAIELIEN
jgi:hypothetical protein